MMAVPSSSLWAFLELVGNHLWQSTAVLAAAGLLTLALRNNRAQVRYWVWLAASLKFLIPFAALMALGAELGWRGSSRIVEPEMTLVIDAMSQPFSRPELRAAVAPIRASSGVATALATTFVLVWFCGFAAILLTWWVRWRRVAATVRTAQPVDGGSAFEILRRLERRGGARQTLAIVSSDTALEPGVFGVWRPALLWPQRIAEHLNDRQIEALLAHELSHVRRRDNLTASLHMLVEAMFWFHPLVWWLGARLLDERERACDEDVLRSGMEPQVYAESILRTCKLCLESPLPCVAGIGGSHLKHRIERIMNNRAARHLNLWQRLLLATAGVAAIGGPIAVGLVSAPPLGAQTASADASGPPFAVASIKPTSDSRFYRFTIDRDGRFTWKSVPLRQLIQTAYRGQKFQQMTGMPSELEAERYEIEARADGNPSDEQIWAMVRRLLADELKLRVHVETRELPVYALVLARSDKTLGRGIRPTACAARETVTIPPGPLDPSTPIPLPCGGIRSYTLKGSLQARFATMSELATAWSAVVGRPIHDRTELPGRFDLEVEFPPASDAPKPLAPGVGPATFAAIEEQLGLRLEPQTGPVGVLVIDQVERPAPDKVR